MPICSLNLAAPITTSLLFIALFIIEFRVIRRLIEERGNLLKIVLGSEKDYIRRCQNP